jgi:hypothetical protein
MNPLLLPPFPPPSIPMQTTRIPGRGGVQDGERPHTDRLHSHWRYLQQHPGQSSQSGALVLVPLRAKPTKTATTRLYMLFYPNYSDYSYTPTVLFQAHGVQQARRLEPPTGNPKFLAALLIVPGMAGAARASAGKRRPPILTTGWYQALRVTRPPIAGSEKLSCPFST